MTYHCVPVDDDDDIGQGDIIRRRPTDAAGEVVWGMILTADCDIANKKTGDRFTWLEIIPAHVYLEGQWATEQLRRLVEKQAKPAAEGVYGLIKRAEPGLSPLTPSALCDWLRDQTADDIIAKVAVSGKSAESKLLGTVRALRVALGFEGPPTRLGKLRQAWTLLGRDENGQLAQLREALDSERGFADFVFVPEIPGTDGYGFVILLRAISSIAAGDLFKTEADARINDSPGAFHRIGRFSDALRFSISQKLAFLFSRIGMTETYEQACQTATDLVIETICVSKQGAN